MADYQASRNKGHTWGLGWRVGGVKMGGLFSQNKQLTSTAGTGLFSQNKPLSSKIGKLYLCTDRLNKLKCCTILYRWPKYWSWWRPVQSTARAWRWLSLSNRYTNKIFVTSL